MPGEDLEAPRRRGATAYRGAVGAVCLVISILDVLIATAVVRDLFPPETADALRTDSLLISAVGFGVAGLVLLRGRGHPGRPT